MERALSNALMLSPNERLECQKIDQVNNEERDWQQRASLVVISNYVTSIKTFAISNYVLWD